jgi:DNA repair protein RecO (recombination protein O)
LIVRVYGEPAFVLHHRPYSETSLILDALTPSHGRVGLLAKGARRPSSPWRGLLKPFQALIVGWTGRGDMPIVIQAEASGRNLAAHGSALYCGFYLNELLIRLLHRHDPHEELFDYYRSTLEALHETSVRARTDAEATARREETVLRLFEKRLLAEIGYGLVLDRDIGSGAPLDAQTDYDYRLDRGPVRLAGGELGPRIEGVKVRGSSLLALAAENLSEPETLRDAKRLMRALLNEHLGGRPLHTRDFFRRVVASPPRQVQRETGT